MAVLALSGCAEPSEAPASPEAQEPLDELRRREGARRAATNFEQLPPSSNVLGSDPYRVRALASGGYVGILRGADAVVLLDDELRELHRLPTDRSPSALVVTSDETVWVGSDSGPRLRAYRLSDARLSRLATLTIPEAIGVRGLAAGPGSTLHAVDEVRGELVTSWLDEHRSAKRIDRTPIGPGPVHVVRAGHHVVVNALLDRSLVVVRVDGETPRVAARVRHDGPFWGLAAIERDGHLEIVATGVEDRPLDRTIGSFGNVDSFVYRFRMDGDALERVDAVNASEHGVVTPKAIALTERDGALIADVAGYGSASRLRLVWTGEQRTEESFPALPGTAAVARSSSGKLAFANPLLDAWVFGDQVRVRGTDSRSTDTRVGEALFFTTLMAPHNSSEGPLSRFTCETCHFEGYVDGRVHHTGRGDVRVSTKPLLGLFNNRPHFSRALDGDLTKMVHNEFRVAGKGSKTDPWFDVEVEDHPWLRHLGVSDDALGPERLRWSLMQFLMEFTHRPNPRALGRERFTELEAAGARSFARRCESCHQARLASDSASSRVERSRWESLILSEGGPIVWAIAEYRKTGVEPYVHPKGARVPSLRRLYKKRPYLTSGQAGNLAQLLEGVRYDEDDFFHGGAPDRESLRELDSKERRGLLAFLDLL